MRRTGWSKTCVWRWQEWFMEEGIEGLLHDKTRPSRPEFFLQKRLPTKRLPPFRNVFEHFLYSVISPVASQWFMSGGISDLRTAQSSM
jgi:hypothetical protein